MRRAVRAERLADLADPGAGLSAAAAAERLARYGDNAIVEEPAGRWRALARDTARDPMIWFLVGTAALFLAIGDLREGLVMLAAILPLVGMDVALHRRTQVSTASLSGRLAERATVLRDGRTAQVPARDVVPGDVALIGAGGWFPADGLILDGDAMQADESALTGEAYPVRKQPLGAGAAIPGGGVDGASWGFAGTRLLTGDARLLVLETGADTLYGEIVRSAAPGRHQRTPLQREIGRLVALLLAVALVLCLVLAWVRLAQGFGAVDAVLSAVTLAVAAIPEEFPVVFTVFLGVGVYRLAQRQALVRRAVVVENIGRVGCICSDKTGTLTEGRLTLTHDFPAPGRDRAALLRVAALASRADSGDPLDEAILGAAGPDAATGPARLASYPFTEDRRRETAILADDNGDGGADRLRVATKGAPETVLALCAMPEAEQAGWLARVEELAANGHKVIACAERPLAADGWGGGEPDRGFAFAGLIACEDPPRDGAAAAVRAAQAAGIRVVMVTGDHPATATAVAREIGIGAGEPAVVEGERLEALLAGGSEGVARVDVVARAVPAHKLALVRAFQDDGVVVAVTGDGVNDVPALQAADIGIAMGERGTRSAREAAAIVLMDDNIRTIVRAIAEGRQLFRNLRLSFAYLLIVHMPFVLTAAIVPLLGEPLLYLPIHIVWIELLIHPTALLVFQHAAPDGRLTPERLRDGPGDDSAGGPYAGGRRFFTPAAWVVIFGTGALMTVLVLGAYQLSLDTGTEHARSVALAALVVAGAALAAILSRLRSRVAWLVTGGTLASAVLLVQVPVLAATLHLTPLDAADWVLAGLGGVAAASPAALLGLAGRSRS